MAGMHPDPIILLICMPGYSAQETPRPSGQMALHLEGEEVSHTWQQGMDPPKHQEEPAGAVAFLTPGGGGPGGQTPANPSCGPSQWVPWPHLCPSQPPQLLSLLPEDV